MGGESLEGPTPPLLLLIAPLRPLLPRPPRSQKPPNNPPTTAQREGERERERGAGRLMAGGAAARPTRGATTVASSGRHGEVETERNPNMGSTQFAI